MFAKIQFMLFLFSTSLLFACSQTQPPQAAPSAPPGLEPTTASAPQTDQPLKIKLNEPFSLKVNQKGEMETSGLRIQLHRVLNDWRCPSQVNCASAGNATVVVDIGLTSHDPTRFEMNINPPPFERDVFYDSYKIQLLQLDPNPETPEDEIALADYQATFLVGPAPPPPTAEPTATPPPSSPPDPTATLVEPGNGSFEDGPSLEAENYYHQGLAMVAAGLPEEAIASLSEALTLYPAYVQAYQIRGDAYRDLRRYDLARADYEQVLALNPDPEMRATVTTAFEEIAGAISVLPTATITPTPAPATPLPSSSVSITLGEPFALKLNQPGQLESEGLTLEFSELLEDTRCPRQVECEVAGQARLLLHVWLSDQEPTPYEFNTDPWEKQDVISYDIYQIRLLSLNPYPETIDEEIALEDYRATFEISK